MKLQEGLTLLMVCWLFLGMSLCWLSSEASGNDNFNMHPRERQDKFPTMYWLPKLHKRQYKERFIGKVIICNAQGVPQ